MAGGVAGGVRVARRRRGVGMGLSECTCEALWLSLSAILVACAHNACPPPPPRTLGACACEVHPTAYGSDTSIYAASWHGKQVQGLLRQLEVEGARNAQLRQDEQVLDAALSQQGHWPAQDEDSYGLGALAASGSGGGGAGAGGQRVGSGGMAGLARPAASRSSWSGGPGGGASAAAASSWEQGQGLLLLQQQHGAGQEEEQLLQQVGTLCPTLVSLRPQRIQQWAVGTATCTPEAFTHSRSACSAWGLMPR